jgi:hypothetical protein
MGAHKSELRQRRFQRQVAAWPDRAWLGRAVSPVAVRQLFHLRGGGLGCPGPCELDAHAVFTYYEAGGHRCNVALKIQLPRRSDNVALVDWVGSTAPISTDVGHRLAWWVLNELCWRPGAVAFLPPVLDELGFDPETYDLDAHPEAFGSPVVDPEAWHLLDEPPPALMPLEGFMHTYSSQ